MQMENTLRAWYNTIKDHAKANYNGKDGWDAFVECVDFGDFKYLVEHKKLDNFDKVFNEYHEWCKIHAEMQAEHDAESDSGW